MDSIFVVFSNQSQNGQVITAPMKPAMKPNTSEATAISTCFSAFRIMFASIGSARPHHNANAPPKPRGWPRSDSNWPGEMGAIAA